MLTAPSPSGKAEVCKTSITRSNRVGASIFIKPAFTGWLFSLSAMDILTLPILSLFAVIGSLAGILAGLFGIGGGIILIPMFLVVFRLAGFTPEVIVHSAFGTSLAIIIPTAISSVLGHRKRGNVDWHQVMRMACGSIAGVAVGSSLAAGLSGETLKGLFGLMQIATGVRMLLHGSTHFPPEEPGYARLWPMLLTGFAVGAFSSFFGVGGGVIAVPLMVILLHQPIHLAVGNSSGLMVISALTGSASYVLHGLGRADLPPFSFGYVNLLVAALIAPATVVCARLGVRLASRLSRDKLSIAFACFIVAVGVYMVASFIWS